MFGKGNNNSNSNTNSNSGRSVTPADRQRAEAAGRRSAERQNGGSYIGKFGQSAEGWRRRN